MGLAVALIFGLYPWLIMKRPFVLWPFAILAALWAISVVYPKSLSPLYRVWMVLGGVLGKINSAIILSLCFLVLFSPVAVFFRLIKRDRLHRWTKQQQFFRKVRNNNNIRHMENPF